MKSLSPLICNVSGWSVSVCLGFILGNWNRHYASTTLANETSALVSKRQSVEVCFSTALTHLANETVPTTDEWRDRRRNYFLSVGSVSDISPVYLLFICMIVHIGSYYNRMSRSDSMRSSTDSSHRI